MIPTWFDGAKAKDLDEMRFLESQGFCWYCGKEFVSSGSACLNCLRFPPPKQTIEEQKQNSKEKRKRGGLRKCPGHKDFSEYNKEGQCSRCGGFKNVDVE